MLFFKALYTCCKDPREIETAQKHTELTQNLVMDYYDASKMPQHNLINVIFLFLTKLIN